MTEKIQNRPYQTRVIDKVMAAIEEGHQNILVCSPTGSGKTIMAHEVARRLYEEKQWKYCWTVMRKVLVEQAKWENEDKFGLTSGTYMSTFARAEDYPRDVELLIEDEAQHSASDTSTKLYSIMKPKVHLAFTATPFRSDRKKLCFSKFIFDAGIRQLVDEKWLSAFHHYAFPEEWSPENVSQMYLNDQERWGKSVIFFLRLADCHKCKALLEQGGVPCEVVEGGSVSQQEAAIEAFEKGELKVLINVFVLTEGFDAPDLKTVFCRPGSRAPTVQMCGRALRKHPDKPFAQIVQALTTKYPFTEEASAERSFTLKDKVWVDTQYNEKALSQVRLVVARSMLHTKEAPMPDYIKKKMAKVRPWRRFGNQDNQGF